MPARSKPSRWNPSATVVATIVGVAALGVLAGTGPAGARTVDRSLTLSCASPIAGRMSLPVTVSAVLPDAITAGDRLAPSLQFTTAVPPRFTAALPGLGATQVDLTTTLHAVWSGSVAGAADSTALRTGLPLPDGQGMTVIATADATPVTAVAGTATLSLNGATVLMVGKTADGQAVEDGTVTVPCAITGGQDPTLLTVTIT